MCPFVPSLADSLQFSARAQVGTRSKSCDQPHLHHSTGLYAKRTGAGSPTTLFILTATAALNTVTQPLLLLMPSRQATSYSNSLVLCTIWSWLMAPPWDGY